MTSNLNVFMSKLQNSNAKKNMGMNSMNGMGSGGMGNGSGIGGAMNALTNPFRVINRSEGGQPVPTLPPFNPTFAPDKTLASILGI